ncbi:MAG: NAD-dependent epimerase/dehydratase family protein [Anaerolineaceae bacterium]|jgi:dihydroflavonol-4-reductase
MNLVTGATGHIGNVLVKELVKRGESVRVLVLPGEDLLPINGTEVEVVYGNVCDPASLDAAFADIEFVFHLAGIISITSSNNPVVHHVNVEGTQNMIDAAMRAGVKRFIYTSSIHAFKRIPHGSLVDETTPIDPAFNIADYDRSKAEATLAVLKKVEEGLPAIIACPTGVIGPYDYKNSELGSLMSSWMVNKVNYMIDGSYDFVDVRDVAHGLILAREKGKIGQLYILSGTLVRVSDLWKITQELFSFKSILVNIPMNLARFAAFFAERYYKISKTTPKLTRYSIETLQSNAMISNLKARLYLGYNSRPLQETVRDTIEWWKQNLWQRKKKRD